MKKILIVSNAIALFVTIIVNYISSLGLLNGNTISNVSAKYQNLFTPAGYAFTIWIFIYLSLILFVIYQSRSLFKDVNGEDTIALKIGWWFVISCISNCLWIIAWLYEFTGLSVLIMCLLLFSLMKIVVNTRMELDDAPLDRIAFVWWPFSLYSGWIAVALIANVAAYLTKLNWDGFGISKISWAVIMICAAGVINLLMTWKRNMREFALVGVWGLVAVAIANLQGSQSIVIAALIVSAILFISSGIHAFKNRKSFPLRSRHI
ncbi:MAG: tryptophan-rich sensory protein [Ignavibacteria bacterium]